MDQAKEVEVFKALGELIERLSNVYLFRTLQRKCGVFSHNTYFLYQKISCPSYLLTQTHKLHKNKIPFDFHTHFR